MSESIQTTFDYEVLDEETRIFIKVRTEAIHARINRTTEDIIAIGKDLIAVQERLRQKNKTASKQGNGQFIAWLKDEFDMSHMTAYRFMAVAERFGTDEKFNTVLKFSPRVLYELAASSTPDALIEQVQSGEVPATLEAIKAAKEAQRQAEQAEQQARAEKEAVQRQLFVLQEKLATLPEPEVQIIEKPVVPTEVTERIAKLQNDLRERTRERDNLAAVRETLSQALNEQRSFEKEQREQEFYEHRIRQNWQNITDTFTRAVLALLAQFPSVFDATECFDATDWARLEHTIEVTQRFQAECERLRIRPTSVIVEASR